MVKHIVMWKVAESHNGMSKEALIAEIKRRIEAMKGVVPQIQDLEVGVNFNRSGSAFDVVLYSTFADRNALDEYQRDPGHAPVKEYVHAATTETAVVDYEL
ncbi:MAG: Dabb family protein [Spirochaetota bacterium]